MRAQNLQWVIGFNKDINQGVHNLTTEQRTEIFYSAAHTGVIYNPQTRSQKLLQGHCNQITCTACSEDKRWIVTADSGPDSMLVVWDSLSSTPVKTFFTPHENGVKMMDISPDSMYIVTLSNDEQQHLSLWDWTNEDKNEPIVSTQFKYNKEDVQYHVRFNLSNAHELCSNGRERLFFLSWEADLDSFEYYCPQVLRDAFPSKEKADAYLTQTVFIPGSTQAVTATDHGDILVWDISLIVDGIAQPNERRLIKVVTFNLMNDPINILTIHNEYLVTGNKDGSIKFYDFQFKICAWFEKLSLNEIKAISFALMEPR